ncbi:MAG: amidohydrolase family protein [Burkholderiaceae bacterium]
MTTTPSAHASGDARNPHLPVDQAWLDATIEPILRPELPIIDAHHHLWDRDYYPYELDRLLADFDSGHDVRASVFVQCRAKYHEHASETLAPVGETEYVNRAADESLAIRGRDGRVRHANAGIVAWADLSLGARVEETLAAHAAAAPARLRGIRNIAAWDADAGINTSVYAPPPGMLADRRFREGFARLAPRELSFDTWLYHTQLDELDDLAAQFPDTRIIVDHMGGPIGIGRYAARRDQVFADWRAAIGRIARRPNVAMKLGGMAMPIFGFDLRARPVPLDSAATARLWQPYVDVCIDAFGPSRCMFASNFPVDKGSVSYPILWNAFKRMAAGYTEAEQARLFAGTAADVYRLDDVDLAPTPAAA